MLLHPPPQVRHLAGAHGRLSALVRVARGMAEEATWTDLRIAGALACIKNCLHAFKQIVYADFWSKHVSTGMPAVC